MPYPFKCVKQLPGGGTVGFPSFLENIDLTNIK